MDNISDFVDKFKSQYIDCDTIELYPDSDFRQIGSWDSLTGMAILVMIHDEYNIDIPVEEFKKLKLIKDVYNYILRENK
jgi:acyl carrier protein